MLLLDSYISQLDLNNKLLNIKYFLKLNKLKAFVYFCYYFKSYLPSKTTKNNFFVKSYKITK